MNEKITSALTLRNPSRRRRERERRIAKLSRLIRQILFSLRHWIRNTPLWEQDRVQVSEENDEKIARKINEKYISL